MFDGISEDRFLKMTDQERRWLNNIKKAVYASDQALLSGRPQDRCLEELCKALDAAKTLRRSLRGEDVSPKDHKKRFIDFVHLDVPPPRDGKGELPLFDARSQTVEMYSFAKLVYAIRCITTHENDNLDAAEHPDYHIRLDWNMGAPPQWLGIIEDGRVTINAKIMSHRLREILVKFITGIEGMIAFDGGGAVTFTTDSPLGSIRPD